MGEEKRRNTLAFLPAPAVGHLVPAKALIKLLLHRHQHLHITVILMDNRPFELDIVTTFIHSLSRHPSNPRLHFLHLKLDDSSISAATPGLFSPLDLIHHHRPQLKQALLSIPSPIIGLILDIFCSSVIDIPHDLSIPPYIFSASSAISLAYLPFFNNLSKTHTHLLPDYITHLIKSDSSISFSTIKQPVSSKLISPSMTDKTILNLFLHLKETISTAKGMLVNSVTELEPYAFSSLSDMGMPVYPVGPLVSAEGGEGEEVEEVMRWLDCQPDSSVVFMCFGSMGRFSDGQVKETAEGVERSRERFLWCIGGSGSGGGGGGLPEGFVERTRGVGRVMEGWAPQGEVLGHSAVGGFVSHCGWNSTLESMWNGVPMATWPLYGEQHVNAYLLVRELGVAVELSMNNDVGGGGGEGGVVGAEAVERGVRMLMGEGGEGVRKKMKVVQGELKKAISEDGGSSFLALGRFLRDLDPPLNSTNELLVD